MEVLLRILQDLVALVLASVGISVGVMTALGNVHALRSWPVRIVASLLLMVAGLWIFYSGIRHMVSG